MCLHGSRRTRSPLLKSFRHIVHCCEVRPILSLGSASYSLMESGFSTASITLMSIINDDCIRRSHLYMQAMMSDDHLFLQFYNHLCSLRGSSVMIPDAPSPKALSNYSQVLQTQQLTSTPLFLRCSIMGALTALSPFITQRASLHLARFRGWSFSWSSLCWRKNGVDSGMLQTWKESGRRGSRPDRQASWVIRQSRVPANTRNSGQSRTISLCTVLSTAPQTTLSRIPYFFSTYPTKGTCSRRAPLISILKLAPGKAQSTYSRSGSLLQSVRIVPGRKCCCMIGRRVGSCLQSSSETGCDQPQVRCRSRSWCTMILLSLVIQTSVSMISQLFRQASRNVCIVFYGPSPLPPL